MKLTDRFRPKADRQLLSELNDKAWRLQSDRLRWDEAKVGAAIIAQLADLYPARDMDLLAKYKCTQTINYINVLVRTPEIDRWSETVSLPLGMGIRVPSNFQPLYCGGEWFSKDPLRGVTAETVEEIKAGKHDWIKDWDTFCAEQDEKERHRVPESLEQWFFDIVDTRKRYNAEYKRALNLTKDVDGKYPTWAEIADMFSTLGQVIRDYAENKIVFI